MEIKKLFYSHSLGSIQLLKSTKIKLFQKHTQSVNSGLKHVSLQAHAGETIICK